MKIILFELFRAIALSCSRLAVWFILLFSLVSSNLYATDYTITVTAAGNSNYIFNSSGLNFTDSNDPDISVNVGDKLIFDATSNTLANHPFAIVTDLNSNDNGYDASFLVSGVTNNDSNGSIITWDLTGVTPGDYYYVCRFHPNMRGKITVNAVTSGVDSDDDGVDDDIDVDDDNDGILDEIEGDGDTDGDGTINRLDLDSDGDECNDVVEAGYIDGDNDGLAGESPFEVTADGKVKTVTYKDLSGIDDLDGNGTKDYLEKGSSLSKVADPASVNVLEFTNVTFTSSGATVGDLGTITYNWQITSDDGETWTNISNYITNNPTHPGTYSDYEKTTLKIDSVTAEMTGFKYRLLMQTLAFKCDLDVTSNAAELEVFKTDTDEDGVPDDDDLDDDNDGILDTSEGGQTADTDSDGIPNRIDRDSDGDNCDDVIEAGFTDENNDGKIGIPTLQVDAQGRVFSAGGVAFSYTTPKDLDGSGTYDFLEAGGGITASTDPSGVVTTEDTEATFSVTATAVSDVVYQWERSTDNGASWSNVQNASPYTGSKTNTLKISSVTTAMNGYQFRVKMSTPSYVCGADVTSASAQLVANNDFDGDGIDDDTDKDDDNDGITDILEGGDTKDDDNDGVPNRLDLDSDNDGCRDALEAGYADDDKDGVPGDSPYTYTTDGLVVGVTYKDISGIDDLDANGTKDYLEKGSSLSKTADPSNANITDNYTKVTFTGSGATTGNLGTIVYKWQISTDEGTTWEDVSDYTSSNANHDGIYTGVDTKTLTIDSATTGMNKYAYRLDMRTPAFKCDQDLVTNDAQIIFLDSDSDGVPDADDKDDDNDGITDVLEGGQTLDTDGDGIPNRLDLDSDGDQCNDVVEAGYVDGDNDGIVGVSPYTYTSEGLVNNETYKDFEAIDDLDGNGTKDFLERGTALSKTLDPTNVVDIEYSKVTFTGGGATVGNIGTITYSWQITTDNGDTWTNVSKYITDNSNYPGIYSGIDSTTLVIDSITSDMDEFSYRLYMQTPAFKCDQDVTTNDAQLKVYKKDTDGDKIPDELDSDDDNDGITDFNEGGEDEDTDGDGIPNRIDPDSDNDGCNDVIEAGFTDENGDGIVGIPVLIVNSSGLVTSHGDGIHSYGTPPDLDGNGVYDFLESASAATIDSSPTDVTTRSNGKAIFVAKGTSDGTIEYTWQVSTDAGNTFTDIEQYDNKGEQSEIMIVGGGFPRFDNHKAFIELYANTDISTNEYKIRITAQNGLNRNFNITSASAGQYIYLYESSQWSSYFGTSLDQLYGGNNSINGTYRAQRFREIDYYTFDNKIELIKISDNTIVDTYGEDTNVNGTDDPYPWATPYGFFKRKDSIFASNEFNETDWIICNGCLDASTNATSSTPYTLGNLKLPSTAVYSGYDDDTLVIHAAPRNFDRYQYRAKIRTVNYACDNGSFTDAAELVVFLDTDGDGVGDADDLDDDNDGILDTEEGSSTDDYDGDGIPNRLDLDSDGDGCDDVIEAGFTDADGDGVPGDGAPTVGTDGKITGHSYADPQDTNSNNVDDFLETSYDAGIYTHPTSVFVDEEDDTIFVSQATLQTRFTFWRRNEPNSNYDYAYMNSNNLQNSGWMDQPATSAMRSVVEFDSLTQETISGLTYMFQHRGHSYYYRNSNSTFDDAVTFAQNAGGYLVVINDTYEAELLRENVRKQNSNVNFWVNHYRDPNADDYVQSTYSTGWVSGYIPNADITYQWQVGVISGSDTTWTDVTNGTNYAGADNDTLRVKAIPASFDKNLYRLKASSKGNACTAGPAYSDSAQLTVSSDPDGDGIKNSVDLDDDNDGILDTEEGGKTLDTDGDGIPNRLDLDSDGDGCLDAEEAGFTGFDSDGRLCANSNCADSNGKVTGHSYADPLDGDSSGTDDYLEFGQSPTITSDLNNQVIIANGSSTTLTVNTTIAGINSPALSYTNWRSGEPNNSNTQNYAYARIGDGLWDDRNNGFAYHWEVVEFNTPRNDAISGYTKLMDDYNGHSYYVRDSYQSYWTNARNSAKNIGGYLVVIDSEVEKDLVHDAVRAKKGSSWNYWIGLYQNTSSDNFSEPSGGWEWVDQPSTVSYTWQVSSDSTNWTTINAENDTVTFSSSGSGSNLFTNGSLTGIAGTGNLNSTNLANWNKYEGNTQSPDINNIDDPTLGSERSTVTSSTDGGTWVGFHDRTDNQFGDYREGLWQSVSLETGKTYTISFEQANFGAINNGRDFSNSGKVEIFIDAGSAAPTTLVGDGGAMSLGTQWNNASVTFTPTASGTHSIGFRAKTESGDKLGAYMSIDAISIQEAVSSTTTTAYTGYGSNSLTVNPVTDDLDGYQYRVIATNPGFKCAVADTSNITTLVVRDDFDGDGIRDDVDVDDDNDGILDTYEGNGSVDTDGDGMPNTKDLDSDGDGCYDVDEAYGTTTDRDPNDDGILGGANPTIGSNGSVSGYNNTQLDQDGNGVKDFLEAGSAITDMSCPDDVTVAELSLIHI